MPKAVMFDCYNTLLRYKSEEDRDGIWEMMKSAIEYMTERELSITPQDLADLYRKACIKEEKESQTERGIHAEVYLRRVWKNVLVKLKIPRGIAEEKAEDVLLIHRLYARKKKSLFLNVQEELIALKEQGMKLLLLSNAQTCFIENELPKETRKLFDEVLISEEMGIKKPSEELFRIAFERLGIKPEEAVFVGDSAEDDMIPSGKLGCRCVMISKSQRRESNLSHVICFNPHGKAGYAGFSKLIADLK